MEGQKGIFCQRLPPKYVTGFSPKVKLSQENLKGKSLVECDQNVKKIELELSKSDSTFDSCD